MKAKLQKLIEGYELEINNLKGKQAKLDRFNDPDADINSEKIYLYMEVISDLKRLLESEG